MERDIKEAWHRMKREIGANAGRRSVAHSRLLAALGVLAACLALATGTGTVFATPSGPGLSVSPGEAAPGKTVTVKGSPEKNPYGPGDQIVIGYAQGDCSNGVTAINGATGTADGKGNISINVTIPTTDPGSYVLCVTDQSRGDTTPEPVPFQVLPAPSITISSPINSGQPITVTGKGFVSPDSTSGGGSIEITYGTGTSATGCENVGVAKVDAGTDGSFSTQFNAPAVTTDTPITVVAVEPQGSCGKTNPAPTAQGSAKGTIVAPVVAASIDVTGPVDSGAAVKVTGQHFQAGAQVQVLYGAQGSDGCATNVGTANVGADGTFTLNFAAPNESKDTHLTVAAVQPTGKCAQPTKKATKDLLVRGQSGGLPFPPQYCLIGLLLLLLLLLLLFLLFRGRRKDEPVTIEERDRVIANPNAPSGAPGSALVDRQIIARDARGKEVVIAEEVTTVSEDEELS